MNTQRYTISPCTMIYVLLMGLTTVTWWIGTAGFSGQGVSLLVLAFALLKGQLIGDFYMGLKGITGLWRWIVTIWLLFVGGLISTAFFIAA